MPEIYKKENCRLCDSRNLQRVLELAATPPGNHFVSRDQLSQEQTRYPLELDICIDCHHLQLGHVVDPNILYRQNYTYYSSTSPVFVNHLRQYAEDIVRLYSIPEGSLVLDIGSNDGTALSFFKKAGFRTLGIDPATEVAKIANNNGIETLCEFFSAAVAKKFVTSYGKAALINSHNVCAHIDDLRSVVEGVCHWLADDGLFVVEVGYFLDVFENAFFDTIYHEHVDYHTFSPLVSFFDHLGLQVISVQRNKSQGGTLRVISQKKGGPRPVDASVAQLMKLEKDKGMDKPSTFIKFGEHIQKVKGELRGIVNDLKRQGKKIVGYGAPTKATTLLTAFGLADYLDYIVDDNPSKQNLFSPGHHIPVCSPEKLYNDKPDYMLVLSWNFADEIMKRHVRYQEQGGRFILPMPKPGIVQNGERLHEK